MGIWEWEWEWFGCPRVFDETRRSRDPLPFKPPSQVPLYSSPPSWGGCEDETFFFLMTTYDDSLAYFCYFVCFCAIFAKRLLNGGGGGDSYFFCFERERDVMCWWLNRVARLFLRDADADALFFLWNDVMIGEN